MLLTLQVLILVLMEDTLRGRRIRRLQNNRYGLNPCFNGRYSQSIRGFVAQEDGT